MKAIVISTSDNKHAGAIAESLAGAGLQILKLDADKIIDPSLGFSFSLPPKSNNIVCGTETKPDEVACVFLHHPLFIIPEHHGIDETDCALFRSGWLNLLDWLEFSLSKAIWINKPTHARRSSSVSRQLAAAQDCGLLVPKTCFTNKKDEAIRLLQKCGQLLVKTGPLFGAQELPHRILSQVVDPDEIDEYSLSLSPCLFQEYIEKSYEVRVHVSQRQVLACKIDSQKSNLSKLDWRNYDLRNTPHSSIEIDLVLANKCKAILRRLGLTFGIIDLIMTPSNETVFLECNASGHWLWIEALTGLPITKQITNALIGN